VTPSRLSFLVGAAVLLASCGGESRRPADSTSTTPSTPTTPGTPATPTPSGPAATPGGTPILSGAVVERLPHDPEAFTQGLFFVNGQLYETTGIEGQSELRKVDLRTGAVQLRRGLPAPYFGEGSVALDGRLYQLTWKNGRAFVYDLATFQPRDTMTYRG
jgi:glutamine cyclotransferase